MSDLSELAWAAGLYDGEGSTQGLPIPARRLKVRVKQMDRGVLDRFRAAVGVGKVYGPHSNGKSPVPVHLFETSTFEDSFTALNALWPFLSRIKKQQAIEAVERMDSVPFVRCAYRK